MKLNWNFQRGGGGGGRSDLEKTCMQDIDFYLLYHSTEWNVGILVFFESFYTCKGNRI